MIPVVTPEEMKVIDRQSPEPVEVLVERAGAAVARAALEMLGGTYGRRVVVVAGKGNNGADGRAAAKRLRWAGVRAHVVDAAQPPNPLPRCDLVIDAAYGTGFRGEYKAPDSGSAPVLAVDIPSGVDGLTGEAGEGAVRAARTVTLAAMKPGLVLAEGVERAGSVSVAGIGLDVSSASIHLVEEADAGAWLPRRRRETHKWKSAVWVLAGSPGMTGAAQLCARSAMRAGAGTVRLGVPGTHIEPVFHELVGREVPARNWAGAVLNDIDRAKAMVVGPGIGRNDDTAAQVRRVIAEAPVPMIIDADGLWALGSAAEAAEIIKRRRASAAATNNRADTVLTPHEGEFRRMFGEKVPPDRVGAARRLAEGTGATVLLKGATTVVAAADGRVLLTTTGDSRLATAGSGDVLAGIAGAFLAQGLDGLRAAAAAAVIHGVAARLGWRHGLVAGDLCDLLPAALDRVAGPGR